MVLHTFQWSYHGSDVRVTGEFDNWSATTSMERNAAGHFVKVVDLPASTKVYYKFVVDGNWCVDGQALKEGDGAHENNYILTGAQTTSERTLLNEPTAPLPVLGAAATYTATQSLPTTSNQAQSTFVEPPQKVVSHPAANVVAGGVSTSAPKEIHYDDSGPSPSDPQAVRNARENPISQAYHEALDQLPTKEEVAHEVQHAVEVAGGFLAAGLAAGAAAFGLSNETNHTESSPITGNAVSSTGTSITSTFKNALTSSTAALSSATESVTSQTATQQTATKGTIAPQSGSLEQAAVAAATSAATNAYKASGLAGLKGVTAPVSSLSQDGSVGFTGIGTAVNQETGVVGTSKIVQSVNDSRATEETHTAQFPSETAEALLQDHENGAKVERINEHAVLAEVGIGGAAVGTALVTDNTVSSSSGLAIPPQAAEHLPITGASALPASGTLPVSGISSSREVNTSTSMATSTSTDTGLAPALPRDPAPVEAVIKTTPSAKQAELAPAPVIQSTQALPQDEVVESAPSQQAVPHDKIVENSQSQGRVAGLPGTNAAPVALSGSVNTAQTSAKEISTSAVSAQTTSKAAESSSVPTQTPSKATTSAPTTASAPTSAQATQAVPSSGTGSRPDTAATKASGATSYETAKTSEAATSPSKAAAQAASKSSTARQNAHSTRTAVASESTAEEGKKKKGLLKRMKSIFK